MTHHGLARMLPAFVLIACGGGDGGRTNFNDPNATPVIANQPPKSSDQLPVIAGQLPGAGNAPGGAPSGGSCESFCDRAQASRCQVDDAECRNACRTRDTPCLAELVSAYDCILNAGFCPENLEDDAPVLEQACSAQAQAYTRCRGPLDDDGN